MEKPREIDHEETVQDLDLSELEASQVVIKSSEKDEAPPPPEPGPEKASG